MPKKKSAKTSPQLKTPEVKHQILNEELVTLLKDLETLYRNVNVGNTTLTADDESKYVKDYLKSLALSKPESSASEKLLKPIMQVTGIENFPEGRVGGGWVDFMLPSSREIGPPVALELKPLHGRDGKLNPLSREFKLLQDQARSTNTNQVIRYIIGGNEGKGVDYIVFTNLQDVYIFDKGCIFEFEPAKIESFKEFVEAISVTKNIPDYLRRVTEEIRKRDLDKYFFRDLENWFNQLQKLDWKEDPQLNSVLLLNKLIFALTLEDFMIIDYRKTWDIFSRNFNEWSAKGPKEVVENFFEQMDKFLYKYYDTELFIPSNNILLKLKDSDESYARLLKALRLVAGFVGELTADSRGLYTYNFRLINEDVFGKAYETYLAENRKESGIYYTPNPITRKIAHDLVEDLFGRMRDEIIQNLARENFDEAIEMARSLIDITIFDPACGSGAFLISALREIINIYGTIKPRTDWINQLGLKEISAPERERIEKVKTFREVLGFNDLMDGVDRVLLSKIILRHIYGCDLDGMAVSVAKVNLWKETVKLNPESFYFQSLPRSTNHILPDLKINFINGNSVITPPDEPVIEFLEKNFKNELMSLRKLRNRFLEDPTNTDLAEKIEETKKLIRALLLKEFIETYSEFKNPLFYPLEFFFLYFDEEGKSLPGRSRPFTGVIGNPPYVESRDIPDSDWDYLRKNYSSAYKRFDLSVIFLEKGLSLLRNKGELGFIISSKFTSSDYGRGIREYILNNCAIKEITDVSNIQVFKDASTYPYMLVIKKEDSSQIRSTNRILVTKVSNLEDMGSFSQTQFINQQIFETSPNFSFSIDITPQVKNIIDKMLIDSKPLSEICKMKDGIHTGNVREKLIVKEGSDLSSKKMITAESIDRYSIKWEGLYVRYDPKLINRDTKEYASLRDERIFTAPEKLMTALFGLRLEVAYDNRQLYANNSVKIIIPKNPQVNLKFVMACLNSRLLDFYHFTFFSSTHVRGGYRQFYPQDVLALPIKSTSVANVKKINTLVDRIIEINEELSSKGKSTSEKKSLETELTKTDKAIDEEVYRIYGISDEEIALIERTE
jgi:type I restriction-modification system DNA methylase subunit